MDGEDFEVLLARTREGDAESFTALYRAIHPGLLRFLLSQNPSHGEDAASETWLDVARGLDGFTGGESDFRAWIFTIGRRKIIDQIRGEVRRPTQPWPDPDDVGLFAPDSAELVERADATRAALALVGRLSPDQAEVVLLRVLAGLDNNEVAAVLGKTSGAVRVLAHRGLRRLGAMLAQSTEREEV
jgi:RNA polymerase sigma-70 factor (ECF subfamily)